MPRGRPKNGGAKPAKKLQGQQSVNAAVKSICDVMRRSNCAGALQYVPELRQTEREENAKAQAEEDDRTPAEILDFIEAKGREIAEALAALRA